MRHLGPLLVTLAVLPTLLTAQDDSASRYPNTAGEHTWGGVTIFTDQDLLDPWRNMDRNYTMGVGAGVTGAAFSEWPLGKLERTLLGWFHPTISETSTYITKHDLLLVGNGFTPDSLGAVDPVVGDRPYGSIFGFSARRLVVPRRLRARQGRPPIAYYPEAFRTELVVGGLGVGVGAWVQTKIHENNSSVVPLGWHNEISDGGEPTFLARVHYERRLFACGMEGQSCGHPSLHAPRNFEATTFAEAMVGYYGNVASGLRARLGWITSEFWDFDGTPLGSIAQAGGREASGPNKVEFFFFGGIQGRAVAWNTLLHGQFKSNPYEIAYSDVEHVIGEFQAGFALNFPLWGNWKFGTGWIYQGRTAEFVGIHARTHTYASAFVTVTKTPGLR